MAIKELRATIDRYHRSDERDTPFTIDVFFVALAKSLTPQAQDEFKKIQKTAASIEWGGAKLELTFLPILLDDLLAERWRETNAEWRTASGDKDEFVTLHVSGQVLESPKSLVFFTKASDLVLAFDKFGYQIFEPNVRCELKRSRVNEAIRSSIKTNRGRKEFKHLNNGITLICASFQKKKTSAEQEIRIRQPGVINGLQTVKSIHDAYDDLNAEEKENFNENCDVLVRLHTRDAVGNYKELVKSTNNQNPMQPRNLRSNDQEQLEYERLFAAMGWFFERKEGAWQAYRSDHSLWGSLKGMKSDSFRSTKTGEVRNIDNLELSQSWLSFIGFSDQAIHNKKDIFVDDRYYNVIFVRRIFKHGYDYDFKIFNEAVNSESLDQAPSHYLLLFSGIARQVADNLTPARRQNRDDAVRRLKIEKLKKEEQDAKLSEDNIFVKGLVLAGAKYLFAEFCGLLLFRALGSEVHNVGPKLLATMSTAPIVRDRDFDLLKKCVERDEYTPGDFLSISWALYNFCLEQIIGMHVWRQEFQQAAVRSRFNYSEFNRRELYKQLEQLDKVYQKRPYPAPWSQGFEEAKGIFASVRKSFR